MRAHELGSDGTILNTIEVESLDSLPGKTLVGASIGGSIGDRIVDSSVVPKPTPQPTIEEQKAALLAKIDFLERNSMENRGARELHLAEMERAAQAQAEALSTPENPITAADVLAQVPYYVKLKALDDEIRALRNQYGALG